jgi:hypothetical protein
MIIALEVCGERVEEHFDDARFPPGALEAYPRGCDEWAAEQVRRRLIEIGLYPFDWIASDEDAPQELAAWEGRGKDRTK